MGNRAILGKAKRRSDAYARQRKQHDEAAVRHAREREREAAQRRAADALTEVEFRWGTRVDALERLGEVGRTLTSLRLEQDALLSERDELIVRLRRVGESWNSLASRTGLSRQALSQRVTESGRRL